MLALSMFAVATLLSTMPALPLGTAPSADAVRRARGAAVELAMALAADGTPRRVHLSQRDLEASATLVGHGLGWLRVQPSIEDGAFVSEASLQLADRTWVNITGRVASGRTAFPDVELQVGAWRFPPWAVRGVLRVADHLARWRGHQLPPTTSMVRDVAVGHHAVDATLAVPRELFRLAREMAGSSEAPIDEVLVEAAYRRLVDAKLAADAPLGAALRTVFSDRPIGAGAVGYNRAALIALAMYVASPQAQRLVGSEVSIETTDTPPVQLGGRRDLAKHFTLSAALAARLDPRFTRAIGEWKELDDSLPGGTGFSFVDLTADRAGLLLARAAIDPATAEGVAGQLASVGNDALFPSAAHRLAEGLSEAEFSRRYGGLEAARYQQAIRRADHLLARLPLYAPYI
jgi:hypothetical protein